MSLMMIVSMILPGMALDSARTAETGWGSEIDIAPPQSLAAEWLDSTQGIVLDEDFSGGIPAGWTVIDGGSGGGAAATWTTANPGGRAASSPITTPFAIVDSDNAGSSATQDEQLITGNIDMGAAFSATLEFDQYFYRYSDEYGDVDVRSSNTGGAWVNVFRNYGASSANPNHRTIDITDQAAGASNVQIRFYYRNGAYDWYWIVDNILVTGGGGTGTPYAIDLAGKAAGWVFVSYPVTVSGQIEAILNDTAYGDSGTQWDSAKAWDNADKGWLTYRKGGTRNTFTDIDDTMGLWLHMTSNGGDQAITLPSTGAYPGTTDIPLYLGWNMVGFPSSSPLLASATLPPQADMVSVWQAATPYIHDYADKSMVAMSHGNGYWVRVTADCTWTVENLLPPTPQIRQTAEFERMQGVLIRYPLGIPYDLIAEMSEDAIIYTVLTNTYLSQAQTNYNSNGVNMANCEWIISATDSYWTRDYGPWWITDENGEFGIVDFTYNRPTRPNDDAFPIAAASYFDVPLSYLDVMQTGGNYMTDGYGISVSTDLVLEENGGLTEAQVRQRHQDSLNIYTYHIVEDVNGDYIKHIDCWAKYLDVDKIMIRQVPVAHEDYTLIEAAVDYFEAQISAYGTPYQVYRVYTPNDEPYSNCLILNDKVLLPITGGSWDDEAIASYQAAMPGFEVLGFDDSGSAAWESTDALHCRARGIPDLGMLHIKHYPVIGPATAGAPIEITSNITAYSGSELTASELFWKLSAEPTYHVVPMSYVTLNQYSASIPGQASGATVQYYIHASDASGRDETNPLIGSPDPHVFTVS